MERKISITSDNPYDRYLLQPQLSAEEALNSPIYILNLGDDLRHLFESLKVETLLDLLSLIYKHDSQVTELDEVIRGKIWVLLHSMDHDFVKELPQLWKDSNPYAKMEGPMHLSISL